MSFNGIRRSSPPSFVHLRRLTDDTGLLEHALGRIPRRREGYTADDNARALWAVTEGLAAPSSGDSAQNRESLLQLATVYLSFLLWTQEDNGWWHNNVAYSRLPEPEELSHDCQGRAIWSCADAWVRLPDSHKEAAFVMIQRAMPTLRKIDSHRGQAFMMAACAHMLEAERNGVITLPGGWSGELQQHLERIELILCTAFRHFSDEQWRWFEPAMTYGNGVLPWAMLRAYRVTRRPETLEIGLDSLSSLQTVMTSERGWFRPIGNDGWCTTKAVSRWDQQPLEMFKLALALEEAATALEIAERDGISLQVSYSEEADNRLRAKAGLRALPRGNPAAGAAMPTAATLSAPDVSAVEHYVSADRQASPASGSKLVDSLLYASSLRDTRNRCLDWFYGDNDLQAPMADTSDGSCCDGLQADGPNVNRGAEATISYLMTKLLCRK